MKFSKMGMSKYISHLDLLRCFTRSIMRSGLPVEYSQGFNPHQKMTFALPLPVGVTSECEFVDISFADGKTTDKDIKEKLNLNLPPDIRVLGVGDVGMKAADIACAEYSVTLYSDDAIDEDRVKEFFSADEVIVMKKTKKKIDKPINLIDYIRVWEVTDCSGNTLSLRLVLDAGGERNLKPDMVVSALCSEYPEIYADNADIHRVQTFCNMADKTLCVFE